MPLREKIGRCLCCGRVAKIQEHHLRPKQTDGFTSKVAQLCEICHKSAHKNFTNQQLSDMGIEFFIHEPSQNIDDIQIPPPNLINQLI